MPTPPRSRLTGPWERLRARLPGLRANLGLNPSVSLERSQRAQELNIVRNLCVGLSRKGVLFKGLELEHAGEASHSAERIIEEADVARKALAAGSPFDATFEWVQDACNELRDDLRRREAEAFPFGESLLEFRSAILQWAELMHDETGLEEARRLALKIDLSNAVHPMGPARRIRVIRGPGELGD